jgi:nitrogen fixation negative regulator NifL
MEILVISLLFFLILCLTLIKYQQKSQESKHNFKAFFDNIYDGILVAEVHSKKFLLGNRKICQMLGYDQEEFKKLNVLDIHPSEHLPYVIEQFEKLSRLEINIAKDIPVKRKNGSVFYVDISSSPKISLGGTEYIVGIFRDISERKQMEQALKESEELHRTILSTISDAVFITDDHGKFTFICPNVHHIFGYSHEEVQKFGHISKLLGTIPFTPESLRKMGKTQLETEIIDQFGGTHFLQVIIKPVSINSGTILYTCSDITECKRMAEALSSRFSMEKLISTISTHFINVTPDELNHELNRAIESLGEFAQVDRSYLFQLSEGNQKQNPPNPPLQKGGMSSFEKGRLGGIFLNNTHEWCASGIVPQIDFLQNVSIESCPWFWEKLSHFENIHIPRVADLPPEASTEKNMLEQQDIQSAIIVPMSDTGTLIGFLGFDSVKCEKSWQEEDIILLKTVADIFANALIRQKTDEKLHQFSRAVEQSANSIVITNHKGDIEYVNPKFTHLTGYRFEEARGKNPRILQSGHTPLTTYQQLWETITQGGEWRGEFCNQKKNGEFYWESASISPIKNATGIITHFLGIKENITERKQVEEALRKEKDKIQTYLDIAGVMFVALDFEQKVTLINQKGCEILGYSQPEIMGANWFDTFLPKSEKEAVRAIFTHLIQGDLNHFEYVENSIQTKDGEEKMIAWHNTLVKDDDGKIIGTLSSGEDITQRKQAEKALLQEKALLAQRVEERTAELSRANAQLERAARLKDEFLANMSHELRTPLNAILTLSGTLQEQNPLVGPLTDKQLSYVKNIAKSGYHLLNLINDILDLSKIEAGKMKLIIEPIFIKEVCISSLSFVKQLAIKKRIKIETDFDDTLFNIQGDSLRLKQILVNLLGNAIKFTPEGGKIGLTVIGDSAQEVVYFTVWDTGIGIAGADMKKLFQSFVQGDSGLTRHYEGTGLGLALVRRLVEMHGGSISVKSEVNKGSQFTVSLPWRESTHQQGEVKPDNLENTQTFDEITLPNLRTIEKNQPLILLAEDNEDNISSISDYLLLRQYRVIIARHGAEALERAKEEHPDIILMDIQMPVMDGLEAIQHLRMDSDLKNVPIIALTALAMPGDRERCLAAGANEYLSKPVPLKPLIQMIEQLLSVDIQS